MNDLKLKGKVIHGGSVTTFGQNDTPKLSLIINTGTRYNNNVKVDFWGDNVYKVDHADISVGDTVVVDFDLKGRLWEDKYYHSLNAWAITKI